MENENWLYSDRVKEHFINPRNILLNDQEFDYHARGMVGNVMCGDQMVMYIKVDPEKLTITDCKWKTYGCASAIASTSVLSEMVKGMTLEKAYSLTPKDILRELGGLPDRKIHCSVLGDKALRAAIDDYYMKHGMSDKVKTDQKSKLICECQQVTEEDIEEAVLEGARTFQQLQEKTKISTGCGKCEPEAKEILKKYINKYFSD
ncbi:MAG: iron-sulfur cluster assembly scaffold protein [bacterium]